MSMQGEFELGIGPFGPVQAYVTIGVIPPHWTAHSRVATPWQVEVSRIDTHGEEHSTVAVLSAWPAVPGGRVGQGSNPLTVTVFAIGPLHWLAARAVSMITRVVPPRHAGDR